MALIHILDELTSNQIAAGEVVERPVNAVKELIENAIDASASEIEVEIAEGGISYIRVTDNGCGMTDEDAKLSIIRHATSKIRTLENIYHIASLGFRGEALPSIMSVSKGRITTRRKEDEIGITLELEAGKITLEEACGAPIGTTVEVRDLFFNVPARKKFMKSERTESSRINAMVGKMALANPGIAFRLINNGRTVLETTGNGRLLDVISSLYGLQTAGEMLPVSGESEHIILEGMISKPSLLKSNRQYQTIIVNGRIVDNAAITKAVDNAYHSLLPKNGHPIITLSLTVPSESIDVNVHPQKREIKFSQEQDIFRLTYHAVLNALTSVTEAEDISTEMIKNPGRDIMVDGTVERIKADSVIKEIPTTYSWRTDSRNFNEGMYSEKQSSSIPLTSYENNTKKSYVPSNNKPVFTNPKEIMNTHFIVDNEEVKDTTLFDVSQISPKDDLVIPLGQVAKCFIVCCRGQDLYIIDQHAAHERIRYDMLAERAEGIPMQELLVPVLMHIDEHDMAVLEEHKEDMTVLGICFEQAGPDVIRVTSAPSDLPGEDVEQVIKDILIAYHDKSKPSAETLRHRVMAFAACRGAIKCGDVLNIRQMKELIAELFETSRPFVCPHGRPTIVRFTPDELGRLFHRP